MSKVAKTALCLMIVTMLSKILGFVRELVLTYTYGASLVSDVYITTVAIPTVLFSTIGAAISTTFIPLFYELDKIEGRQKTLNFTNNILNIIILLSMGMAITGFIFAEPLVKIFAINFEGDKLKLAINFTRIMIFGVLFIGLSNMMTAWLQVKGKFSVAGMVGIPFNIFIIMGILLSTNGNVNIMAIGSLVAMASMFLFQLPFVIKSGYKYNVSLNLKDENIKKMIELIIPVFIGVGVNQINSIVDRSLASTLGNGYITVLNSANRLNGFVLGLFIISVTAVIFPRLSKLSNDDKEAFIISVYKSINSIVMLILPISIGCIVLAEPVVKIVFERGAFNSNSTTITATALACYSIGMIGFALREILSKVFYSIQDTRTPMVNGALAMGMNIILNIILIKFLGYIGLALATSISALICIVLLFNSLRKKIRYFGQDKIIKTTLKSLISAIVMGIVTYFMYNTLANILGVGFIQEAIALFVSIGIGAIVYCALVIVLKVEEVSLITNMVKKKITA